MALWAAAYFFMLLAGYYVLRPLRDQLGIAGSVKCLPWMFMVTFVSLLVMQPLYGALVKNLPRRLFIALVYQFFAANLVVFWLLLHFDVAAVWVARVGYLNGKWDALGPGGFTAVQSMSRTTGGLSRSKLVYLNDDAGHAHVHPVFRLTLKAELLDVAAARQGHRDVHDAVIVHVLINAIKEFYNHITRPGAGPATHRVDLYPSFLKRLSLGVFGEFLPAASQRVAIFDVQTRGVPGGVCPGERPIRDHDRNGILGRWRGW